jgi:DNA-binding NtrC family response regulator
MPANVVSAVLGRLRHGAFRFLPKPVALDRLVATVHAALTLA